MSSVKQLPRLLVQKGSHVSLDGEVPESAPQGVPKTTSQQSPTSTSGQVELNDAYAVVILEE